MEMAIGWPELDKRFGKELAGGEKDGRNEECEKCAWVVMMRRPGVTP